MKRKTKKKIVVLLSGGLDSSTIAYLVAKKSALYQNHRVYTLTFDYGQRHKKELNCASSISKKINAVKHTLIKLDLTKWGGSALTDRHIKVPLDGKQITRDQKLIPKSIPITYVPARNTVFLSLALAYAEAVKAEEIYIGVNSIDYSGYVDCRGEYIRKFQELANLATVSGIRGKLIKIKTPLINMSKKEIVKLGNKLGVDWANTWSCYLGGKKACGRCDSCRLRLKGFREALLKDPLEYDYGTEVLRC